MLAASSLCSNRQGRALFISGPHACTSQRASCAYNRVLYTPSTGSQPPHLEHTSLCHKTFRAKLSAHETQPDVSFGISEDEWDWLERSEVIMGSESIAKLRAAHVIVVGVGGVGSWCAEMLARSGVGHITLIDGDCVDSTNRNRQLIALSSTTGVSKVQVLSDRLADINPSIQLTPCHEFMEPAGAVQIAQTDCSFIVDCIDSVTPKRELITAAVKHNKPIISSMGAGGKRDPSQIRITDISLTFADRFARCIRKGLAKYSGIKEGVPVVFSTEPAVDESVRRVDERFKRSYYGTMSYMPALFGMHMSAYVINELCGTTSGFKYPPLPKKTYNTNQPKVRKAPSLTASEEGPRARSWTHQTPPASVDESAVQAPQQGVDTSAVRGGEDPEQDTVEGRGSRCYPWGCKKAGIGQGYDGSNI